MSSRPPSVRLISPAHVLSETPHPLPQWYRRFDETLSSPTPSAAAIEGLKPVDNSRIATPEGELKVAVAEGVDVEMVPQTAWDALKGWSVLLNPSKFFCGERSGPAQLTATCSVLCSGTAPTLRSRGRSSQDPHPAASESSST